MENPESEQEDGQRSSLAAKAALYASTKLAEEETRARFVQNLHRHKPGI